MSALTISLILVACLYASTVWRGYKMAKLAEESLAELETVKGQLEAEQRKVAMIHAARSDASRKGAVTKRAKRIHLPGVGS